MFGAALFAMVTVSAVDTSAQVIDKKALTLAPRRRHRHRG
jgi:hypothetical protein